MAQSLHHLAQEPITAIPAPRDLDPRRVALGERLFQDVRLSRGGDRSCASCHDPMGNGATGADHDRASDGRVLPFNTPTVFNAALSFRLNWEGNYRGLEEEIEQSLHNADTMGTTPAQVLATLGADPDMVRQFREVYGRAPVLADMLDALATYERSLLTPDSRFDRWLGGDAQAITAQELDGYRLFKSLGCVSCHQGVNVGGNLFQKPGIFHPLTTAQPEMLRVPSLRNVAATAPYFHDGSAATLPDAVRAMAFSQLDRRLTEEQTSAIVAFLRTLTGNYRGRPVAARP